MSLLLSQNGLRYNFKVGLSDFLWEHALRTPSLACLSMHKCTDVTPFLKILAVVLIRYLDPHAGRDEVALTQGVLYSTFHLTALEKNLRLNPEQKVFV